MFPVFSNSLLIYLQVQLIQNAAARRILNLLKFSYTRLLLRSLHWLSRLPWIRFKIQLLAYCAVYGSAPSYIQEMIKPYTPACTLCSASANRRSTPSARVGPRYHSTKSPWNGWTTPHWYKDSRVHTSSVADWKPTCFNWIFAYKKRREKITSLFCT